jgi:SAM-dependent methyltransferase
MEYSTERKSELSGSYRTDFYQWQWGGSLRSASEILPFVFGLCHPRSICDLGCGTGAWRLVAKGLGATEVFGVDGPHVDRRQLLIEEQEFVQHDFAIPYHNDRRFDLSLSLEAAEHLEPSQADAYLDELMAAAPVVLFPAAQGGSQHVNEQWPSYWIVKFAGRTY